MIKNDAMFIKVTTLMMERTAQKVNPQKGGKIQKHLKKVVDSWGHLWEAAKTMNEKGGDAKIRKKALEYSKILSKNQNCKGIRDLLGIIGILLQTKENFNVEIS